MSEGLLTLLLICACVPVGAIGATILGRIFGSPTVEQYGPSDPPPNNVRYW